jgi:DNA-binding CsgD family transcriptional regulator
MWTEGAYGPVRVLADTLAESAEPFFVVALDGTIIRWNGAVAELLGISPNQAEGQSYWVTIAGRTSAGEASCGIERTVLDAAQDGTSLPPIEMVLTRRPPLDPRTVLMHHLILKGSDGQPQGVLHLLDDVEARGRRERIGQRFLALTTGDGHLESALTPREVEVLRLLTEGYTAREVAHRLDVRHATARNHMQHILDKLGARSHTQALARLLADEEPRAAG